MRDVGYHILMSTDFGRAYELEEGRKCKGRPMRYARR